MTHGDISEDCLYLNIWTPAKSAGEKLPVFLWMYGGGNVEGSASVPAYDGEHSRRRAWSSSPSITASACSDSSPIRR